MIKAELISMNKRLVLMHTYLLKHGFAYVSLRFDSDKLFKIEKFNLLFINRQRQLIKQTKRWSSHGLTIKVFAVEITFYQMLAAATNYCLLVRPTSA